VRAFSSFELVSLFRFLIETVTGSCVKLGAHEGEEAGLLGRACVGAEFARVWWRGRCVSPKPISGHVILVCRVESSPFDQ